MSAGEFGRIDRSLLFRRSIALNAILKVAVTHSCGVSWPVTWALGNGHVKRHVT